MIASSKTPESRRLAVLAGLGRVRGWEEDFYRELHAHPELSHQEIVTSSKVSAHLRDAGYEVQEHLGGTGIVGVMRGSRMLRRHCSGRPGRDASPPRRAASPSQKQTRDDDNSGFDSIASNDTVTLFDEPAAG